MVPVLTMMVGSGEGDAVGDQYGHCNHAFLSYRSANAEHLRVRGSLDIHPKTDHRLAPLAEKSVVQGLWAWDSGWEIVGFPCSHLGDFQGLGSSKV